MMTRELRWQAACQLVDPMEMNLLCMDDNDDEKQSPCFPCQFSNSMERIYLPSKCFALSASLRLDSESTAMVILEVLCVFRLNIVD